MLIDEDYAAADLVCKTYPLVCCTEPDRREYLANEHAKLGPDQYHMRYSFGRTISPWQEALVSYWHESIGREELRDVADAEATRPVDAEVLCWHFDDLKMRLDSYSKVWKTVQITKNGATSDNWSVVDERTDRLFKNLDRDLALPKQLAEKAQHFLEEVRADGGLGTVRMGTKEGSTVSSAVMTLFVALAAAWDSCKRTTESKREGDDYPQSQSTIFAFARTMVECFVKPSPIRAQIDVEFALARTALKRQSEPQLQGGNQTNITVGNMQLGSIVENLEIATAASSTKQQRAAKPQNKRGNRAANIEGLEKEMIEHLRDARDHAFDTKKRTGTPELLPRPTQRELAKRTEMKEWNVSRCFSDASARELNLYWKMANDLAEIMKFKGPISRGST